MDAGTTAEIAQNLIANLEKMWDPIQTIAYAIGVLMFLLACFSLAAAGSNRQGRGRQLKIAFASYLCSVALLSLPGLMDGLAWTFFNQASMSALDYSPPAESGPEGIYLKFVVYLVMTVGVYAIIKGILMWRTIAEGGQRGVVGSMISHLVGGILCVNIITTLHIIGASLGPSVEGMTKALIG